MAPPTSSLPEPAARCVPYERASPREVSQALLYIQEELQQHFPTLGWLTWANALLALQPDLWVEQETVSLDQDDLTYLVQQLAGSSELPELDPLIHGPRAGYLAKKLVTYQDDAIYALADIEANPLAYGPSVYRLVTSLAVGNGVADEVFRATHRGPQGRPGGPDPAGGRATVHERLKALRCARGEVEFGNYAKRPIPPAPSSRSH